MSQQHTALLGLGGAPTRATTLPTTASERKQYPVGTGVLDYFPDALVAIARLSWQGNEQHNPGQPLHWARDKSTDEADTMIRHYLQRGTLDTDGMRHTAKMAWRALALLQKEIEAEAGVVWGPPVPTECGCTEPRFCSYPDIPHPNLARGLTGLHPDNRFNR